MGAETIQALGDALGVPQSVIVSTMLAYDLAGPVGVTGTVAFKLSSKTQPVQDLINAATNRTDLPELSGSLREASNSATDALAGKGPINFGMGTFNGEQTLAMGEAWVGPNYRVTSKGYYESADGLRQFRPPSAKEGPFASTGVQPNFEQRLTPSGAWGANGHVNVTQ